MEWINFHMQKKPNKEIDNCKNNLQLGCLSPSLKKYTNIVNVGIFNYMYFVLTSHVVDQFHSLVEHFHS